MDKSQTVYDIFKSPLGSLYIISSVKFLVGISFRKPAALPYRKGSAHAGLIKELTAYFEGSAAGFTSQKIKFLKGTDFERQVWAVLNEIPFGETRTYKWVAEKIGNPSATRAVGRALSKNPIPLVVPCHRVIESDGSIGGYSSGINIKRRLLDMEYYAKMDIRD